MCHQIWKLQFAKCKNALFENLFFLKLDLTKRGKRRSVGNLRANQKVQKKDIIMKPKMMTLHQGLPMLMIS